MNYVHRRQRTSYYCGPAVIQMIAAAFGIPVTQRAAAKLAKTDKLEGRAHGAETGTSIANLVDALRQLGLQTDAKEHRTVADLKRALKENRAVIVCFTERHFNWGHYAIVVGWKGRYIDLLDPDEKLGGEAPMTVKEFERRWQDPLHTKSVRWAAFVSGPQRRSRQAAPVARSRPRRR